MTCVGCGNKYYGETGRNTYSRAREHVRKLNERNEEDSALWRHCEEKHSVEEQAFRFDVIQTYKQDAMLRQISESVLVNRTNENEIMNGKTEWDQPRVPRITIR